ncbi:MAG: CBS domain-containing protein [Alphaproteobacteria bacterium]|nr:CBS domain-containing protein [Alphaproteobacteria bacterium]
MTVQATRKVENMSYLLSNLIGGKAKVGSRAIGKLADMIMSEGPIPEVTHLVIKRPFGYKSLLVPWDKVAFFDHHGRSILDLENIEKYEKDPAENQIVMRDYLLDKKVLDVNDAEVEVVYDIKLQAHNNKLYVAGVDCSRAGFLRRIGLRRLSDFIRSLAAKIKDETIPWTYLQPLPEKMGRFKGDVKLNVLKEKVAEINPVDIADMIEELEPEHRMAVFNQMDTEQASDTLEEIEPRVQRELVASLPLGRAAELINEMSTAQAANMLSALPASEIDEILERIDPEDREKIRLLLERHDDHISSFASSHYIAAPPEMAVGEVIKNFRRMSEEADVTMYIYVTSPTGKLIGVVDIKELLQSDPAQRLGDIMVANVVTLGEEDTVASAVKMFNHYGFRALPVVGEDDVLKGVIPDRDVTLARKLV